KLKWKKGLAAAYRAIGINYSSITVLDTAQDYLEKSLKIFTEIEDNDGIAKVYGNLGNVYNMQGHEPKALEMHLKALSMNEDLKDERSIAGNLSNIGVIYFAIGKVPDAINYVERAVKLNIKHNNKTFLAINYHELGRFHESLQEYDKAFDYSSKAYNVSKEIGDKTGMTLGLEGMGFIYESKKEYSKALGLYSQVLQIRRELDDKLGITGSLGNIALCYLNMSKESPANKNRLLDSAAFYSLQGIETAKEIGNFEWQNISYGTLSQTQQLQGRFEESLESYKQSIVFRDSMFNSDKRESIKNLEDKREIELRDKQLKINELEIDNRKRLQWLFIAGIGFLGLIGALLFRQNKIRKKNNEQLQSLNGELVQANETKTRFLGILNHDLRSPVANLIQFLNIQKNAPDL
ncbi:MAG: tetratricopeptide repeat protein, partial [Sphingobacteriales bacterium]